jgi:hypothetical protein
MTEWQNRPLDAGRLDRPFGKDSVEKVLGAGYRLRAD